MANPALTDYYAALQACVNAPTPANAAAVLAIHAVLPKSVGGDRSNMARPECPQWVINLAAAHRVTTPPVILGRPSYGDGR